MHLTVEHLNAAMDRFRQFTELQEDAETDDALAEACEAFYASVGFSREFRETLYELTCTITEQAAEPYPMMMAALLTLLTADASGSLSTSGLSDDTIREALGL